MDEVIHKYLPGMDCFFFLFFFFLFVFSFFRGQKALSDWATCYRLASTMLFEKRQSVHDVTIFGAGKQAYWHARLALLLRGEEIHHMNFGTSVPSTSILNTTIVF